MGILSVRPSICLSDTTRYGSNVRSDRDSGSSPYDSLGSLVSNEAIWCRWVRRFPSNEGIKEGHPSHLEFVILPLLAHLAWKRLQIDTDLLLIIASTVDELSSGTNIDDLERLWAPEIGVLANFQRLSAPIHILRMNCAETIQDRPGNLRMKCSALNVDFNGVRFKDSSVWAHQIWVPPWKRAISATVD